jgi:hypothetical protein
VKEYWSAPLGVATTIPAPGKGTGWMYFRRLRAGLAANACRTVHGNARAALAPALYFRKDRLVIVVIASYFISQNVLTTVVYSAAKSVLLCVCWQLLVLCCCGKIAGRFKKRVRHLSEKIVSLSWRLLTFVAVYPPTLMMTFCSQP